MPPVFLCLSTPICRPTQQKLPETAIPRPEFFAEAGKSDPPSDLSDVHAADRAFTNNSIFFRWLYRK
jgi:hypothetical protein